MENHENNDHGHSSDHDHTEGNRQYYSKGWWMPLIGLVVIAMGFAFLGGTVLGISGTDKWGQTEQHVCTEHCGPDCKEKAACEKECHDKGKGDAACCDKKEDAAHGAHGHDAPMKDDAKATAPTTDSAKTPEAAKPEAGHGDHH